MSISVSSKIGLIVRIDSYLGKQIIKQRFICPLVRCTNLLLLPSIMTRVVFLCYRCNWVLSLILLQLIEEEEEEHDEMGS